MACNKIGPSLGGKIAVFGYADNSVLLRKDTETIKINTMQMKARKKLGLKINSDKNKMYGVLQKQQWFW